MSKKSLPPNCEIDWIDHDERAFRLVFWGDDPYYTEELYVGEGEHAYDVGVEYIEHMGWTDNWPNKTVDTDALLDTLEELAEEAIYAIENNPECFGFSWDDMVKTFSEMNLGDGRHGEDIGCEPYPYFDEDHWAQHEDEFVYIVEKGVLKSIELSTYDGSDWETECYYEGPEDNDQLLCDSATASCHYHCLKCNLYDIYVARTGEDPLGNVMPEKEDIKGACTITISGGNYEFERRHGPVPNEVQEAFKELLGEESSLREDIEELKMKIGEMSDILNTGRYFKAKIRLDSLDGKVVIRSKYEINTPKKDQMTHNKEVAWRNLEKDVRSSHKYVMDTIAKKVIND